MKISFTSKSTENLINLDKHEFKTTLEITERSEASTDCVTFGIESKRFNKKIKVDLFLNDMKNVS